MEHAKYADYYIFQNTKTQEFLSIYNKQYKENTNWIGKTLGLFYNDGVSIENLYQNKHNVFDINGILNINENNPFVFKIMPYQLSNFNNLLHVNFKRNNNKIIIKLTDANTRHKVTGYLTCFKNSNKDNRDTFSNYAIIHKGLNNAAQWEIVDGHINGAFKLKLKKLNIKNLVVI